MISGLIPHRYARALYKFAGESNSCEAVYAEMNNVIEAFRSNPHLEKVLSNPFVDRADKKKLLLSAAGKTPGEDYTRFVSRIPQVRIVTAAELPKSEIDKLKAVVERSFPGRTFEYECRVNPDIIGGFVIDVDSTRMDASISSELEQLRQNLSSN